MTRPVILLTLLLSPTLADARDARSTPNQPSIAQPPPALALSAKVDISGGLSKAVVHVGKPVRFWLTIQNRTSTSLEHIILSPSGLSGYKIVSRCWRPVSGDSCVPVSASQPSPSGGGALASEDLIVPEIEAGQTLAVWGELRTEERQEKQTLDVTVLWLNSDRKESRIIVPLGDLASENYVDFTEQGWAWIQGFLKDLGWPVLLAFLAYRFKKWEDDREAARRVAENDRETKRQKEEWDRQADRQRAEKDLDVARQQAEKEKDTARNLAEKELDRQRQELQREREHLLQTWHQMLPVSHENATKHYMPLLAAAKTVLTHLKTCSEEACALPPRQLLDGDKCKHALFYYLLLRRRNRRFTDERGGYYFKDRVGEDLAAACWGTLQKQYTRDLPEVREKFSELVKEIEPDDLLATFMKKFRTATSQVNNDGNVYQVVYDQFRRWLGLSECLVAIRYLRAYIAVLEFEMNKPYSYWYPEDQKQKLDESPEIRRVLDEIASNGDLARGNPAWKAQVEGYIQRSI